MSSHAAPGGTPARARRAPFGIADWAVWTLPARVRFPVLLVEATTLLLLVALVPGTVVDGADLLATAVLIVAGVLHTEIAVGVERIRRRVTEEFHVDLTSVWTFAGALLLPPALAAAVAAVIFTHLWWRSWRPRVPPYRHLFSTATISLSCLAAGGVLAAVGDRAQGFSGAGDLVAAGLALLVYTTVNSCLVAGAIAVSVDRPELAKLFGDWNENALEIATLSLGGLTAMALSINPLLVPFALPPLLVLHRAVLVRHLEEAANTDAKTGLLNAAAWHTQAERELRRARRADGPRGVLVLDLDHFKAVNDAHGHLAGDKVLAEVATELRNEVRERDLVGRFGGEEFVVLLAGPDRSTSGELGAVAERIRRRIESLRVVIPTPDGPLTINGLTVSIGGADAATSGGELQSLLQVADAALYAAKRAGRNRVQMGVAVPAQVPAVHPTRTAQSTAPSGGPRPVEPPAAAR